MTEASHTAAEHAVTEYRINRLEIEHKELVTSIAAINTTLTSIQITLGQSHQNSQTKESIAKTWVAPIITAVMSAILIYLLIRSGTQVL